MSERNPVLFISDLLDSINKIEEYVKNKTYEQFENNSLLIDGVIRNLEIIGEASSKISVTIRDKYLYIPWKRMIGLRNLITHEYFGIDSNIIWDIIQINLPETKPKIEQLLNDLKNKK